MKKNLLLPALLLLVLSSAIFAQSRNEAGTPFITNYPPKDYGAHPQNWSIIQDQRGIMYFANSVGALEYDGVSWRLIPGPNRSLVRSFALDENNKIYVGGNADFGYLTPDPTGQLRFVTLLDLVKEEDRQFGNVWHTFYTPEGIYFLGINLLFRYRPPGLLSEESNKERGDLQAWKATGKFLYSALIRDELYVHQAGVGLMRMSGDRLELLPGGEQFADRKVEALLPYDKNRLLLASSEEGLYLYDGNSFLPFASDVSRFIIENQLMNGSVSPNSNFAFATMRGGVALMNKNGDIVQILDKTAGLLDNFVRNIYFDRHGAMWLALDGGIARAETPSPLSVYDDKSGLESYVSASIRHKGTLYVATGLGVYYLDSAKREFKLVSGITARSWWLLSMENILLVATDAGVYGIEGDHAYSIKKSIEQSFYAYSLHRSKRDYNRVYVGLLDGFAFLRLEKGKLSEELRINGQNESVRNFVETENGKLWMGTHSTGVLRVDITKISPQERPVVERFGPENNLPLGGVSVFSIAGKTIFAMRDGLRLYDETEKIFVPDSTFELVGFGGSQEEYSLKQDNAGNIWMNFGRETAFVTKQADGSFSAQKKPFLEISDLPNYFIYPDDDGVVWFGSEEMMVRYDPSIQKDYALNYPALIRRVVISGDSVIFGGVQSETPGASKIPRLRYVDNSVRIEYAATSFEAVSENRYQTYLEGFDRDWSEWTEETRRDFTNLSAGNYQFHVRAKNIYQHPSSAAVFEFRVLPPWYRSWLAYGSYVLVLGLFIVAADRFQRRRVINRERQRAQLREAELRAESAEALAKSESERKKNIELLSDIGKEITASLDMDTIFHKLYEHINQLADAAIFGVGIYYEDNHLIDYRLAIEKGKRYQPYTRDTMDKNQFPVWCIDNRKPVFINDVRNEYSRYIREYKDEASALEDVTVSDEPHSIIYLPLLSQERVLGVITIQSFQKNAYNEYHLSVLRNLATYTAIALDNANAYRQLNATLENLKATQQQLVTQEKLASLGALTAGIAHEIKNPLNFVNNFAELSQELVDELRQEIAKRKAQIENPEDIDEILSGLQQNAKKINEHGKRADSIVRSMLQHSRGKAGERQPTDINAMLEEDLNLAYHGLRARDATFNIAIEKDFDENLGEIEVVPQNISRVFLNVISNGFYAAHLKAREGRDGESGKAREREGERVRGRAEDNQLLTHPLSPSRPHEFRPTLLVSTKNLGDKIEVRIRDNGQGIPGDIRDKIFQPFFTTKPTGQGTGLGLSISYDIVVQEHNGEIRVDSKEGEFAEFIISLPR